MSLAPVLHETCWLTNDPKRPGHVLVRLTPGEMQDARLVAEQRLAESRTKRNRVQNHDPGSGNYKDTDFVGCLGEKAVNKLLDSYWHGAVVLGDRLPEDDGGWEVKSTRWPSGRLLLQYHNKESVPAVLAIPKGSLVRIPGWLWLNQGKKPEWWDTTMPTPCYAVPQSELMPVSSLIAWRVAESTQELNRRVAFTRMVGA